MFDFASLKAAQSVSKVNKQLTETNVKQMYDEAVNLFEQFKQDKSTPKLKASMVKFASCLKFRYDNKADTYLYLAKGFFVTENDKLARKYFEIARRLNPDHPEIKKSQHLFF